MAGEADRCSVEADLGCRILRNRVRSTEEAVGMRIMYKVCSVDHSMYTS